MDLHPQIWLSVIFWPVLTSYLWSLQKWSKRWITRPSKSHQSYVLVESRWCSRWWCCDVMQWCHLLVLLEAASTCSCSAITKRKSQLTSQQPSLRCYNYLLSNWVTLTLSYSLATWAGHPLLLLFCHTTVGNPRDVVQKIKFSFPTYHLPPQRLGYLDKLLQIPPQCKANNMSSCRILIPLHAKYIILRQEIKILVFESKHNYFTLLLTPFVQLLVRVS